MKIHLLLLTFFLFIGSYIKAQVVSNVKVVKAKENLILIYDFKGETGAFYQVNIFYNDKYNKHKALMFGEGAIGDDIEPGRKKVVYVKDKDVFENYSENTKFKFETVLTTPPLRVTNNLVGEKIKRGKMVRIEWMGGKDIDFIHIALFKGRKEISRVEVPNNVYSYDFKIPKKTKGKDYELKLIRPNGKVVNTGTGKFTIKPGKKVWLLLIAGLGGGLVMAINDSNSSGSE